MNKRVLPILLAMIAAVLFSGGCSLTSIAVGALSSGSDSGPGALSVFMRENDPEIVADSLPTLIKTMEALLASDPDSEKLGLTVGSAYIMYANAFVEGPANRLPDEEYAQKSAAKARAKNFYLRGATFIGDILEKRFPGITADPAKTAAYLPKLGKKWVPYAYWFSAGTCAAFGLDPMSISLSLKVPQAKLLLDRALEVDPEFMGGGIADLFISFHASMPDSLGGDRNLVQPMFEKALSINKGKSPGTYIAYANGVCVPNQDIEGFKGLMAKALAINPDDNPDSRLMTILSQRNARFYLDNIGNYFLIEE
jgi:predicted anti-sigma-YlaC factor YlaD